MHAKAVRRFFVLALAVVLFAACNAAPETVEVTRVIEVTRQVSQPIPTIQVVVELEKETVEVTRIVEVPVTPVPDIDEDEDVELKVEAEVETEAEAEATRTVDTPREGEVDEDDDVELPTEQELLSLWEEWQAEHGRVTNDDIVWVSPQMQEEESWPPGAGMGHFDLGVEEGEVTLVFGVNVEWEGLQAGNADWEAFDPQEPMPGCALIVLTPGFYPDLGIVDGRYENYRLPERDHDGWITVLATQRMEEQSGHYDCPKSMDHVEVWSGDPMEKPWAERRRASGIDYLIPFNEGDTVFGFSVYRGDVEYIEGIGHEGKLLCDGGNCYLPEADFDGWCGGCWVNSWWPGELEEARLHSPIDLD